MLLLTKTRTKITSRCNSMLNLRKKIHKKFVRNQNNRKFRDHCCYSKIHRSAAHGTCNLRFNVPNETPVVFQNGSNYDYYFIIKELTNEFE